MNILTDPDPESTRAIEVYERLKAAGHSPDVILVIAVLRLAGVLENSIFNLAVSTAPPS